MAQLVHPQMDPKHDINDDEPIQIDRTERRIRAWVDTLPGFGIWSPENEPAIAQFADLSVRPYQFAASCIVGRSFNIVLVFLVWVVGWLVAGASWLTVRCDLHAF